MLNNYLLKDIRNNETFEIKCTESDLGNIFVHDWFLELVGQIKACNTSSIKDNYKRPTKNT